MSDKDTNTTAEAHEALAEAISDWAATQEDDHQVVIGWVLVAATVPSTQSDDVLYHHAEPTQPWHAARGLIEVARKRLDHEEAIQARQQMDGQGGGE